MELKQEGIDIESINSENIFLPDVENVDNGDVEVETETEVENNNTQDTETNTDTSEFEKQDDEDERKKLQNGINAERKRRKEAERKFKELEAQIKSLKEEKNKEPEKPILDTLLETGMDENVAKSILKAIDVKKTDNSKLERELAEMKFDRDLTAKSKEAGFEDILDYADEIKDLVDKGLTIEQSYYATVGTKAKSKDTKSEIERKVEAKMQNNATRKEILGGLSSNAGAKVNSKGTIKASQEERAMASAAGITVEEYVALRDMNSTKDYDNYKKSRK